MIARAGELQQKRDTVNPGPWVRNLAESRTVVVVSPDAGLRERLRVRLVGLRWQVREAAGGAQAMQHLEAETAEAMLLDPWLPDLEAGEFAAHVRMLHPEMELLALDGSGSGFDADWNDARPHSPRRNELLQVIREADPGGIRSSDGVAEMADQLARGSEAYRVGADGSWTDGKLARSSRRPRPGYVRLETTAAGGPSQDRGAAWALPDLVGSGPEMRELARLVRLVAPRSTTVLIEGETGTGKEVVARALHTLSRRAAKPFAVLNCAAIPEALLEAELFGHTRGAFTGAVQSRTGRIEAANGGTLLLDEIGEMPLGMQAKMLRFLESGELQRVGDNETTRVDVRLIAATHRPLEEMSAAGTFRLDLYHRLAVFPIEVAPLRRRMEDIPQLAEHFLQQMGRDSPRKRLDHEASLRLQEHAWPGNVRELMHVLERAAILAGENPVIAAADIRYRRSQRNVAQH